MNKPKIKALILSAGFSGRMKTFKPLLVFQNHSFLYHIVGKASLVCQELVVVTGFQDRLLQTSLLDELRKEDALLESVSLRFVFNKHYARGMFSSLQAGLSEIGKTEWILYHFVDQPGLPPSFYEQFVAEIDDRYNWIQPLYKGRKGHPLLLGKPLFKWLLKQPVDSNLHQLSREGGINKKWWECPFPRIFQDIDTPRDFKTALDETGG